MQEQNGTNMQWEDEGVVLSAKPHGESGVLLELMTATHGRHLGMVRGGRSRNKQPIIQLGNRLHVTWNARLEEHLGVYSIEPLALRTDLFLANRAALCGLNHLVSLLRLLPERDPYLSLYQSLDVVIDSLHDVGVAAPLLVRFELLMLQELGFGLDLTQCAVTGMRHNLVFVSPKSGRAVSERGAGEWRDKLLPLPLFCAGPAAIPSRECLINGFRLTEYFMRRDIYDARGLVMSDARAQLLRLL